MAGLAFTGDLFFWHLSILSTTVANATFFATTALLFVILIVWLVMKQRVSRGTIVGLLFCLLGGGALTKQSLAEAVNLTLPMLQAQNGAEQVHSALTDALRVSQDRHWRDRLPELGEGWVAEEALAIAVLCALAAETPREAIIAAANHDGDTDSTASITGNIIGALYGPSVIPAHWADQVELRDVIETLALDFTAVLEGRADPEELWDRYPGHQG